MLQGPLVGNILLFTLPLAATGILQQLFNAADVAVVGRFAGKEAMAAVGSNVSLVSLLVNLFVGISLGANVVISQALGQGDTERVSRAVHTSVIVALVGGVIFAVVGEVFVSTILGLLSVPGDVVDLSRLYLRIYLLGLPVIFLYNFESSIYRSMGDTRTPLVVLMVSGVVNVCLNLVFVIGLGMTVDGVALATVISNALSAVVLFALLCKGDQVVRISLSRLRVHVQELTGILRIGLPAGVQGSVFSLSNICVQSAINSLGTTIIAASSAALYVEIIVYYLINGFGQACTTFTGQNYGAGNMDRCKRVLRYCVLLGLAITIASCAAILLVGKGLLGLFTTDAGVVEAGYVRLVYIFCAYPFTLFNEMLSGHLRGFGLSALPAAVSVLGICLFRVFWVFEVFPRNPSFAMILVVYPISLSLTAATLWLIYFFRARRRMYQVRHLPGNRSSGA